MHPLHRASPGFREFFATVQPFASEIQPFASEIQPFVSGIHAMKHYEVKHGDG